MEKPIPMDRLICGDVGYGKTEIAVRAAFKAVQDGKQVAVLVPTTLLVQQHLETFTERYQNFPVVGEAAVPVPVRRGGRRRPSRGCATAPSTSSSAPTGCSSGEVRFKDLGLIVVDEEQRFGVEHKEKLKQLRTNVDVLAMSATPIPRTLEMAVTGIREMSTLATPPEERHPVLTFVGRLRGEADRRRDPARAAARGPGLLHPQQGRLDRARRRPAARAGARGPDRHRPRQDGRAPARAGHRRLLGEEVRRPGLHDHRRDRAWTSPTPTPSILERADLLGLSQLHQLRGRVGRGPGARLRLLPVPARAAADRDRARPAADHRPAHRPRRRDAGRDEGPRDPRRRQPARRRAVRATSRASGSTSTSGSSARPWRSSAATPAPESVEMKVELPVDAHLPHDYVPGERLRLEAYRKIAEVSAEDGPPGGPGGAAGPVRPAAGAGREPARRRPAADHRPPRRAHRDHRRRATRSASGRSTCPTRPQTAAQAALPGLAGQARGRHDARAAADDRAGRRHAAARPRGPALGRGGRGRRCSAGPVAAAAAVAGGRRPACVAVGSVGRSRRSRRRRKIP